MNIIKREQFRPIKYYYFFLIVLIILGSFFDYAITNSLNGNLVFLARFTEIFGEVPWALALAVPFAIFAAANPFKTKIEKITYGFYVILGVLFSFMIYFGVFRYLNPSNGNSHGEVTPVMTIIAGGLGVVTFIYLTRHFKKYDNEKLIKLKYIAKMILLLALLVILVSNVIKIIHGRPRFWTIVNPETDFFEWYQILGPTLNNENMSFVSGHTSNALVMIAFSWLYLDEPAKMKKTIIASLLWGSLVAAGRLFSGQHFMTDVAFAGIVTITIFLVIQVNIEKRYKKNHIVDEQLLKA